MEELSPQRIRKIESRMRPGAMSQSGFLDDSENLIDVIRRDRNLLESVEVAPSQIADRLESLVGQAHRIVELSHRRRNKSERRVPLDLWHEGVRVGPFELRGTAWEGVQECPFVSAGGARCTDISYAYWDFNLVNLDLGVGLAFPGLAIHLIRDHHFFEGDVAHRVEPLVACHTLEIEQGRDYSPQWSTERIWAMQWGTSESLEKWRASFRDGDFVAVVREPDSTVPVGNQGRLYFKGDLCVAIPEGECWFTGDLEVEGAIWTEPHLSGWVSGFRRKQHRYVKLHELNDRRPGLAF